MGHGRIEITETEGHEPPPFGTKPYFVNNKTTEPWIRLYDVFHADNGEFLAV